MKIGKIIIIAFISFILVINPMLINDNATNQIKQHQNYGSNLKYENLANSLSITIMNNTDLLYQASIHKWVGTGTGQDPIIIENSNFTYFSISNTNLYLTIQNNTFSGKQDGIYLYNTSFIDIYNNNIINNGKNGIWSSKSANNTIEKNNLSENDLFGIYIYYSDKDMILDNKIMNNKFLYGMEVYTGLFTTQIINNTLIHNLYLFNGDNYLKFDGNTVDGLPILYYFTNNMVLSSYPSTIGQLRVQGNNISVSNLSIKYGLCATVYQNSSIFNNTIAFPYLFNNSIADETHYNLEAAIGIYNEGSFDVIIKNNTIRNADIGIKSIYSLRARVFNNTIINSTLKIGIMTHYEKNSSYIDNALINNRFEISRDNSYYQLSQTPFSEFFNYTIVNNTLNGEKIKFITNESNKTFTKETFGQLLVFYADNFSINASKFDVLTVSDSHNFTIENSSFTNSMIDSTLNIRNSSDMIIDNNLLRS